MRSKIWKFKLRDTKRTIFSYRICFHDCKLTSSSTKNTSLTLTIWSQKNSIFIYIISENEMHSQTRTDYEQCFTLSINKLWNKTLNIEFYTRVFVQILTFDSYSIFIMSSMFCSTIQFSFNTLTWTFLNIWRTNMKSTLFKNSFH